MKKVSVVTIIGCMALGCTGAVSNERNGRFKMEIANGLDSVRVTHVSDVEINTMANAQNTTVVNADAWDDYDVARATYGEMGVETFYDSDPVVLNGDSVFIPAPLYTRMGGGLNLGMATTRARRDGEKFESSGSWSTTIGLGMNFSSYVRGELAFQESLFKFSGIDDNANYHMLNAMVYFDFARRFIVVDDTTYRRTFVPFMGLGLGLGWYDFWGANGVDGFVVAVPRLELGMNFAITDMIGFDIAYQYQMTTGRGFGWGAPHRGVSNMGNIVASIRMNF